jgi:hypothetical protein
VSGDRERRRSDFVPFASPALRDRLVIIVKQRPVWFLLILVIPVAGCGGSPSEESKLEGEVKTRQNARLLPGDRAREVDCEPWWAGELKTFYECSISYENNVHAKACVLTDVREEEGGETSDAPWQFVNIPEDGCIGRPTDEERGFRD